MPITLQSGTPAVLDEVVEAVALWQEEGAPVQLHPGDLGWAWRFGDQRLADEIRLWRRDGQILAAGTVDSDDGLIRMAIAPSVGDDEVFAAQLLADLSDPERGVLPAGRGSVEARAGAAFRDLLHRSGWVDDEPWTPLHRGLTEPVEDCGLRIGALDADHVEDQIVHDRVAVGRAMFTNSTFTLAHDGSVLGVPASALPGRVRPAWPCGRRDDSVVGGPWTSRTDRTARCSS